MRPIGIFDSGYGGLTIFRAIKDRLPQYDYIYLGDNARAPYGDRSFETVYQYTLECVQWLLEQNCPLIILACNTASAKALRNIQQLNLPQLNPDARILGVIRPTAEIVGAFSQTKHIGILGTKGTVNSGSYPIEVHKFFPEVEVFQHACPMWVHFVENKEYEEDGIDYYIKKDLEQLLQQSPKIDTVLLACTHYPLLSEKISKYLPENITLLSQGELVAKSLQDYLHRHSEIEQAVSRNAVDKFYTTDDSQDFEAHATYFFGENIKAESVIV